MRLLPSVALMALVAGCIPLSSSPDDGGSASTDGGGVQVPSEVDADVTAQDAAPSDAAPSPDLTPPPVPLPACETPPAGQLANFTCNDSDWPLALGGWLTTSITPPSYPYVVTGSHYYLTVGGAFCHGETSPHRILFFLGDTTTPPANPTILAEYRAPIDGITQQRVVASQYQSGILVHSNVEWTVTLPKPIVVPYGKTLFISVALDPGVCVVSCFGQGDDARNWYGGQDSAPYTWNPVVRFQGLDQAVAIAADGHAYTGTTSACAVGTCDAPTDLDSDRNNCGACGNVCAEGIACRDGGCECPMHKPDACTGASGDTCVDLQSDRANCGQCGHACGEDYICTQGTCVISCVAAELACPAVTPTECIDPQTDANNCGGCGIACAVGASCVAGQCTCGPASNSGICENTCVDLDYDPSNCGACGTVCDGSNGATCVRGVCGCPGESPTTCGGTCADLANDANNCGGCGNDCAVGEQCTRGICTCAGTDGFTCGAACVDINSDASNCGGCGIACGAGLVCLDRACVNASTATGVVSRLAGSGSFGTLDGIGTSAQFFSPTGITTDASGFAYVADSTNRSIRRINLATREVTTLAGSRNAPFGDFDGTGAGARFNIPRGIVSDGAGSLYVADALGPTIRKIDIATRRVSTIAGRAGEKSDLDGIGTQATFTSPFGLALDDSNHLFVTDSTSGLLRRMDLATGAVVTIVSGLTTPRGVAFVGGALYVSQGGTGTKIWKLVTDHLEAITGAASAPDAFYTVNALTHDAQGNLYATDAANPNTGTGAAVRRIQLSDGAVTTIVGGGASSTLVLGPLPSTISASNGITFTPSGGLLMTLNAGNSVLIAYP